MGNKKTPKIGTNDSNIEYITDIGLGNYVFQEARLVMTNLVKDTSDHLEQQDQVWELYFDGSRSKNGSGGGAMLSPPSEDKYYTAFHFSFS